MVDGSEPPSKDFFRLFIPSSSGPMGDYRRLLVWQQAHALTLPVYKTTTPFPGHELYGLTAQLRRGAASVAANLAEGCGRGTQPELARFSRIAAGSLNELEYHLLLARELAYLPEEDFRSLSVRVSELRRRLTRFIQAVSPAGNR